MSSIGDWPTDLLPYRWEFYLQPNTRSFMSPVTRTRQVLEGQGPRWVGTGSFRFKTRRKEQRFEALLDKLKGQVNTVNVWDFAAKNGLPLGPMLDLTSLSRSYFNTPGSPGGINGFLLPGSPSTPVTGFIAGAAGLTVFGAHAIGSESVEVRGFPQGTVQLYAGDGIQIGSYLYRLTEDQPTASSVNRATLSLNRPLLAAAAHGATVTTTRPRTPMRLLDDDHSRRSVDVDHVREWTVSLEEVLI